MRPGTSGFVFRTVSDQMPILFLFCSIMLSFRSHSQVLCSDSANSGTKSEVRRKTILVSATQGLLAATSFTALQRYWYHEYPSSRFHFTNDVGNWNNMDKAGHMWSAYTLAKTSAIFWRYGGLPSGKADLLGVSLALGYQTAIEINDGFSSKWGFSWGDFGANVTGAGLYAAQQMLWNEQRFQLKVMAFKPYRYPEGLKERSRDLFGKNLPDKLLSDYNIQSYWLGTSLNTISKNSHIPPWLGIAVGYGSGMMLGETSNQWRSREGILVNRTDIARQHRFFLALDFDLTKIRTRSNLLRSMFQIVNSVKIPSPTLEYRGGRFHGHFLMLN